MGIKENYEFLHAIAGVVGRPLTVAECYIAFALRDGKYQEMKDVPPLPVKNEILLENPIP
jgi:hypothetical protein